MWRLPVVRATAATAAMALRPRAGMITSVHHARSAHPSASVRGFGSCATHLLARTGVQPLARSALAATPGAGAGAAVATASRASRGYVAACARGALSHPRGTPVGVAGRALLPRGASVCGHHPALAGWRSTVRTFAGRAGRRQRRVVVYTAGPGGGAGGAGSGIMGALALAGLAAGAVVAVLVGSVVVVVVGVGAVLGLAFIRFFPVRHPVLRSIKGALMMRSQHKQAIKRAFTAIDVTMARVRRQSLEVLKEHAAAQEALGTVRKLTPVELKAVRTLDGEDMMAFLAVEDGVAGMREIEARAIATGSTTIAEVRLVAHLTIPTVAEAEETLQDGGRPSSDDNPVTRLFRKWFGDGSATGSSDSSDDVGGDAGPSEAYRREEKVKFIDLQLTVSPTDTVVHLIRDGIMVNNTRKASPIDVDVDPASGAGADADAGRRGRKGRRSRTSSRARPLGTTPDGSTVFDAQFRDVKDK